jgi:hypothetical protein
MVDDAVAEVLRRKTATERIAIALDANRTARMLIECALRRQHPEWAQQQINAELARRMSGGPG